MKLKALLLSLVVALGTLTGGCSVSGNEKTFDFADDFFVYGKMTEGGNSVVSFDVSDDGDIYSHYLGSGVEGISVFSPSGEKLRDIPLSISYIDCVASDEKTLYILNKGASEKYNNAIYLNALEGGDTESKELCRFDELSEVVDCEIVGGVVYVLGIDSSRSDVKANYESEMVAFNYGGESVFYYNTANGEAGRLDIDFPIAISAANERLYVYGCDDDTGYYLTALKDGVFGEKKPQECGQIHFMEIINSDGDFVFESNKDYFNKLCVSGSDGISELMPDVISYGQKTVEYKNGYLFYLNSWETHKAVRIKLSSYLRTENAIKLITAGKFFEIPFSCGYSVAKSELDDDEFALTVLSQDTNYDMCFMDSRQDFAVNIRDKGSFYPLNEVEGINEYLDACFPYVKAAATDENGDIWMLPISVEIPIIMYNNELCGRHGIDFTKEITPEQLLNYAIAAYQNPELKDKSALHPYTLTSYLLMDYLQNNDTFETPLFRDLMTLLKQKANTETGAEYSSITPPYISGLHDGALDKFAFAMLWRKTEEAGYAGCEGINACPIPKLGESDKNVGSCIFLSVNPSSKNLGTVLKYLESVIKYINSSPDAFMLSDKTLCGDTAYAEDLFDIYENGSICFNISDELFRDDYKKYLRGETALDAFIGEIDRKLSAYLNE